MKCEFCGHDNDVGAKFCGKCGAQVPEAPSSGGDKTDIKEAVSSVANMVKVLPAKKLLKFAIPVVVLIVALLIAIPILIGPNIATTKNNISFFTDMDGDVVVSGNNNARFTIDGEMRSSQKSIDGSKAVVLTDYRSGEGGTLWFVTASNATRIAEDVLSYQLADSGNGVVYATDYDRGNDAATLYLYNTSSKNATRITDDLMYFGDNYGYYTSGLDGVCISPDGKSVAYVGDYDSSHDELTGYIKIDGKASERLGNNMFAVAISNSGKHIYYVRMTDDGRSASLHVKSGRNDNRLVPDISSLYGVSMLLNRDYSEIIFNMEDRAFISRNGGERARISGSAINGLLLPQGSQMTYSYGETGGIAVYGVRSFANTLAVTDGGIELISKKFETDRVSGSSSISSYNSPPVVSSDGKTLLFLTSSGQLNRVNPTKAGAERDDLARNVSEFVASGDGKTVFYITNDDELWCVRGNRDPSKIADYASGLAMSSNSKKAFFLLDYSSRNGGDLHYSNNGSKSVKIVEDVTRVWSTPANVFYRTIDSDLFRSNGNEKFTLFQEDVS